VVAMTILRVQFTGARNMGVIPNDKTWVIFLHSMNPPKQRMHMLSKISQFIYCKIQYICDQNISRKLAFPTLSSLFLIGVFSCTGEKLHPQACYSEYKELIGG
jgi:hypothetical protein